MGRLIRRPSFLSTALHFCKLALAAPNILSKASY